MTIKRVLCALFVVGILLVLIWPGVPYTKGTEVVISDDAALYCGCASCAARDPFEGMSVADFNRICKLYHREDFYGLGFDRFVLTGRYLVAADGSEVRELLAVNDETGQGVSVFINVKYLEEK